MERRRIIAHRRQNRWTSQQENRDLGLNRRRIVQKNLELNHLAEIRRHVDHDRLLRNQDDLVPSRDLGDLDQNPGDQSRVRRIVSSLSEANPNHRDHDHDRDPRNPDPRAKTGASRENRDPTRVTRDPPSLARNLQRNRKTLEIPIENATVVQAAALDPRRRKIQRTKTTSRYERKRMVCKLRDLTEKPIKTIVVVIATLVGRENQLLSEEVPRPVRTGVDLRIETETDHEIDHETDHEIDREIDHAIDHEIGTEGEIYKSFIIN